MPTYEYVCRACKKQHEIFHSITESAKTDCPACKKPKLERLISATAAPQLQGAGWYRDGYSSRR